jgi:hypothetical protein
VLDTSALTLVDMLALIDDWVDEYLGS